MLFLCQLLLNFQGAYALIQVRSLSYKYRNVDGVQVVLSSMRPAVVALIASAGASILMLGLFQAELYNVEFNNFRFIEFAIFAGSLFILRRYKTSAIAIILGSGMIGTLIYVLLGAV